MKKHTRWNEFVYESNEGESGESNTEAHRPKQASWIITIPSSPPEGGNKLIIFPNVLQGNNGADHKRIPCWVLKVCSDVLTIEQRLEGYSAAAFSVFHLSLSLSLWPSHLLSPCFSPTFSHLPGFVWMCMSRFYGTFPPTLTRQTVVFFLPSFFFAKRGVWEKCVGQQR